jgi:hypothetical protein
MDVHERTGALGGRLHPIAQSLADMAMNVTASSHSRPVRENVRHRNSPVESW